MTPHGETGCSVVSLACPRIYRELRAAGRSVWMPDHRAWALAHHRDVRDALGAKGLSGAADDLPVTGTPLCVEGAQYRGVRRALGSRLHRAACRERAERISARAAQLTRRVISSGVWDATVLGWRVSADTALGLLGVPERDRDRVLDGQASAPEWQRGDLPVAAAFHRLITSLPDSAISSDSWTGALRAAAARGKLPSTAGRDLIGQLVLQGADLGVHTITTAVRLLSTHPDQWLLLRAHRTHAGWVETAVHEALRYAPPVIAVRRTAREPLSYDGVRVPAGDRVLLLYGAAGRDPNQWGHSAAVYDIRRRAARDHLSLGGIRHTCSGLHLAVIHATAVLRTLAEQVSELRPAPGRVPYARGMIRGWQCLPTSTTP
ncbi:cytochrome P450 [Streptomyces xiamenensis]|uniref:cytochrome P450 n=1 Tax=Streptomyces xiamenensis TaxID=408015 RepID=UPI0036EC95E7